MIVMSIRIIIRSILGFIAGGDKATDASQTITNRIKSTFACLYWNYGLICHSNFSITSRKVMKQTCNLYQNKFKTRAVYMFVISNYVVNICNET